MAPYDQILRILNTVPNQRMVLQVQLQGAVCVTRVFPRPVQLAFDPLVRDVTLAGRGSTHGLPEELTLPLEGYRVRASLGEIDGLPGIVGAGVSSFSLPGIRAPSPPFGYAFVTTRWAEGDSLRECRSRLPYAGKVQVLAGILQLLGELHERLVTYGDLKPHNIVLVDGNDPWLIDLDTLRQVIAADVPTPTRDLTPAFAAPEQVEQHLTYLASDIFAFGRLASWLLEPELADGQPRAGLDSWRSAVAACLARSPAARPTCADLHWTYLLARPSAKVGRDTIVVDDGTLHGIRALGGGVANPSVPAPSGSDQTQTVFVPDWDEAAPEARPAPGPEPAPRAAIRRPPGRTRAIAIAVVFAAAVAAVAAVAIWKRRASTPSSAADPARPAAPAAEPRAAAVPPDAAHVGPKPFDLCMGDDPHRVTVTYLRPQEPVPSPEELRAWFPGVDPDAVRVYALRYTRKPPDRSRFVALELSRDSWPDWSSIAGQATGKDLCWRIGGALVDRRIGRPGADRMRGDGYEFDIITGRAATTDEEFIGTLSTVLHGDGHDRIASWVQPAGLSDWTVAWRLIDDDRQVGPSAGKSRLPASFDQNWGDGPLLGSRSDYLYFSATAILNLPQPARVTIVLGSDDGARLDIDGQRFLDHWRQGSYRTVQDVVDLGAGTHTFTLQYYELRGDARVSFEYYVHADVEGVR